MLSQFINKGLLFVICLWSASASSGFSVSSNSLTPGRPSSPGGHNMLPLDQLLSHQTPSLHDPVSQLIHAHQELLPTPSQGLRGFVHQLPPTEHVLQFISAFGHSPDVSVLPSNFLERTERVESRGFPKVRDTPMRSSDGDLPLRAGDAWKKAGQYVRPKVENPILVVPVYLSNIKPKPYF